jgi:ATP-dependent helicase HrpB
LNATLEEWLAPALAGVTSKSALRALDGDGMLRSLLTYEQQKVVDEACPTHVTVPSGSKLPIEYDAPGGTPVL